MAIIIYETLTNGQQVAFTTGDVLQFNNPELTPHVFRLRAEPPGSGGVPFRARVEIDASGFADIYLTLDAWALTSGNFVFASGGFAFIGDNTPDIAFDDAGIALNGSEFDDYFLTGAGNDLSTGEEGNDSFELRLNAAGKYGHDTIDGGSGSDWLWLYQTNFISGVTVDLALGTMTDGGGPLDSSLVLISIENVDGSPQNDTILGDDGDNELAGSNGNDVVRGRGGDDILWEYDGDNDTLDGGDGNDTVVFDDDAASDVVANLSTNLVSNDGLGGTDTLISIENLEGAQGNDTLTGDAGDNRLGGGAGNDTLSGLAGDDRLLGGAGNDTLNGGAGNDILDGGAGLDIAVLNGLQSDIRLSLAPGGAVRADRKDGTDSDLLIGIETLRFSDNSTIALDPANIGLGAVIEQTFPDDLDVRVGRVAATRLTDQSIVLTWEQSDGTFTGIFAQRYDSNGQNTIGGTFRVNSNAAGRQNRPSITDLPDGGYLITWTSTNDADTNGDIFARRFSFDGTPLAAEQRINLVTAGNQYIARANYIEETGQVGIGWTSGSPTGEYLTGHRYNLTATGISTTDTAEPPIALFDFRPNDPGTFASPSFRQARDFADGSSVQGVLISDFAAGNYFQSDSAIRIFVPGSPSTSTRIVVEGDDAIDSSGVTLIQMQSGTTMFGLWSEDTAAADPVAFMARLEQGATALEPRAQIGTDALYPSGQQLADGTILVVWTDGSGEGIVGRWLTGAGAALTDQFIIVASEPGRQLLAPQVVALEDGNALVVYSVREADGAIPVPLFRQFAEAYEAILLRPSDLAGHLPRVEGGDGADTLTDTNPGASEMLGGAGNDSLSAGAGDDRIDGGTGADQMNGGTGNDIYVVDDAGDVLIELGGAGSGEDSVEVLISEFTLPDNVENLEFITADDVTGTGNAGENAIISGAGDDTLDGAAGDDILLAGGGNDSVTGGDGTDLIDGGGGTDTAVFDGSQSDFSAIRIILGKQGAFTFSGATAKEMVLLTDSQGRTDRMLNVERVKFADGEASLTGNNAFAGLRVVKADLYIQDGDAVSALVGTAKAEVLDGLDGDDTLRGGAGNDLLLGRDGNDTLEGGAGNDVLDGGAGTDTLNGGAGNDLYMVEVTPGSGQTDTIVETATGGTDTISTHLATFDLLGNSVLGAQNIEVLEFLGVGSFSGTGNERANLIRGGSGDDTLLGGAGNDRLVGLAGNDTLDGGTGADRMEGGAGNDTYVVDRVASADGLVPGDVAFEGSSVALDTGGTDTVQSTVTYTLGLNVENLVLLNGLSLNTNGTGNALNNTLTGNDGNNVLSGGAGNDIFFASGGNDRFVGGAGADTLNLASLAFTFAEKGQTGGFSVARPDTSTIVITDLDTGQKFTVTGAWGSATAEKGIESYVFSDQTVTLAQLIANTASAFNDTLTGGDGADSIEGGAGNDTLDGGGGDDTLTGGLGNDTYVVDSGGDQVIEALGQGTDIVNTGLNVYELGANVEQLLYTGVDVFTGTGNALANRLTGAAENDTLSGLGGNDTLIGNAGDDTLDGGLGADRMEGGAGNDTYFVDRVASADGLVPGDVVFEGTAVADAGGTDTVHSAISYTLGTNVENLVLTDTGPSLNINGTGNGLDNTITGNAGNNRITGGAGNDTAVLTGVQGDYTFTSLSATTVRAVHTSGETDTLVTIESVRFSDNSTFLLSELLPVPLLRSAVPSYAVPALVYPEAEGARWNVGSPLGTPASVTFSFMATIPAYSAAAAHPGFQPLTAAQQVAVREILGMYSAVANITFTEVADAGSGGQLRLGRDSQSDSLGYTYVESLDSPLMGDVWLSADASENLQVAPGQVGRYVLLHEIGHALGLKHSGNNGAGDAGPFLPVAEDSQLYSVMSYDDIPGGFFAEMPMLYDIAALQALYGPNMNRNAGNTVYSFPADHAFNHTIWDGSGADTFDFSGFTAPVSVNLQPGAFSTAGEFGVDKRVAIAYGTAIEKAIGGSGADTMVGNVANNTLDGGAGNDILTGGAGADVFDFSAALGATNVDTITDFVSGTDRIRLDADAFAGLAPGALGAGAFHAGSAAHDADDRIVYDQASGSLYFDVDGIGGADAVVFAVLGTSLHPALVAADFGVA